MTTTKRVVIIFAVVNGLLLAALAGLYVLSETYPFRPGGVFYGVQDTAEQWRLRLTQGTTARADLAIDLAERRLGDLAQAEAQRIDPAVTAFGDALVQAARYADMAASDDRERVYGRVQTLLTQADLVVTSLAQGNQAKVMALSQTIATLRAASSLAELAALVPLENTLVGGATIPFLESEVDHEVYPLTDGHADVACDDCHQDGFYAGTSTECEDCHKPSLGNFYASYLYPSHFGGACTDCHDVVGWDMSEFDHVGIVECTSCHQSDIPFSHYVQANNSAEDTRLLVRQSEGTALEYAFPDRCETCHPSTEAWDDIDFDHTGFTDCRHCHLEDTDPDDTYNPVTHYRGQCSRCHTVVDWNDIHFDHTGYTACADCHSDDVPAGHVYAGTCANCHTTTDWNEIAFNHAGYANCVDCHTRPNHYHTQCADCHTTTDWSQHTFSHSRLSNCATCHAAQAPAGHYAGQCSSCHSTNQWGDLTHRDLVDCASCHSMASHYPLACSYCHDTVAWCNVNFDHTRADDCTVCHTTPAGHWPGSCSDCHNTYNWRTVEFVHNISSNCLVCHAAPSNHYTVACITCHTTTSWGVVVVNHSSLYDCLACHAQPDGHWPGQCSDCHTTSNWADATFNHAGYTNCKACHAQERPANHARGQCSRCHTTDTWAVPSTPTPTNTPLPPTPTNTPVPPPTPTSTPLPPTPTNTPAPPPTPTSTPTPVGVP
ncbi:MAG: hypothetical protein JXD18_11435 [Anaerolineae bacterium]|nr:hypothetical protein [Anaerolineae bacterium]